MPLLATTWLEGLGVTPSADYAGRKRGWLATTRRPCPECGEMIAVGAAKCRFCGAVFDPRLRRSAVRGGGTGQSYNGFAITSMVLGIVGIPGLCVYLWPGVIMGIVAVVFGIVALKGMKNSGNDEGKGMAIAGLVLGIVVITIAVLLIIVAAASIASLNRHHF